jgi:3-deoxy-D-manno-octulosonic-acid transferase
MKLNRTEPQANVEGTGSRFKVLLVPRHPQRFNEVEALVQQHGLRVSRRSGWDDAAGGPAGDDAQHADVWLGDSLGEMALYFSMSDVALLGGSFAPLGGQNLIEAAACGCPVVMGPHTFNFTEAAELAVEEGAARRVIDMEQGVRTARKLMDKPEARAQAVAAGLAFATATGGLR